MPISSRRARLLAGVLVSVVAATGLVLAGQAGPATAATPVRVMPLGDSITGSPGCWRAILWNRLRGSGYTDVDFVGTLNNNGSCGQSFDGDNEGHGGFSITGIANANQLPGWLRSARPDVVMAQLGTNDVWSHYGTSNILASYAKLVDQMRASNPSMTILIAKITPMSPAGCGQCWQDAVNFDNALPGWAAARSTSASPITVVDQWSGYNTATDTTDGVHPNGSGNQKIADRWYPALTAALSRRGGGTSPPPAPGGGGGGGSSNRIVGVASGRCIDLPGLANASGTRPALWDCNGGVNQRVVLTSSGQLQVMGKCLDAFGQGRAEGTQIVLWDCNGGSNQAWSRGASGSLVGRGSGLCLDAANAGTANGTQLQLWGCNGGGNQGWTIR